MSRTIQVTDTTVEEEEDGSQAPKGQEGSSLEDRKVLIFDYVRTALYYFTFIAMGSVVSIPGPTLLDLAYIVGVDSSEIGIIFTFRSIGFLVGAFSAGILLDILPVKVPVLVGFALCMGCFTLAEPFSTSLNLLKGMIFLSGVSTAGLNNGVNVHLLNIWGRKADSYYLALHFSFAVGAFIGPIISGPFLEVKSDEVGFPSDGQNASTPDRGWEYTLPTVTWAYVIITCLVFISATALAVFTLTTAKFFERTSRGDDAKTVIPERSVGRGFILVALTVTAATIFSIICIETGYSSMLLVYAVKGRLRFSKRQASYLNSVFWAAYMVTRFVSIFVAVKVPSEYLIAFDVITLVASGIVLSCLGTLFEPAVWVGTVLAGMGIATLFPSTVAWVGRYIHITFKVGSLFFIMGSVSEMIWPAVLASYVTVLPDLLFFFVLFAAVACLILHYALAIVFSHQRERFWEEDYEEVHRMRPSLIITNPLVQVKRGEASLEKPIKRFPAIEDLSSGSAETSSAQSADETMEEPLDTEQKGDKK